MKNERPPTLYIKSIPIDYLRIVKNATDCTLVTHKKGEPFDLPFYCFLPWFMHQCLACPIKVEAEPIKVETEPIKVKTRPIKVKAHSTNWISEKIPLKLF